jgi:ATP-dependent DNA ligase
VGNVGTGFSHATQGAARETVAVSDGVIPVQAAHEGRGGHHLVKPKLMAELRFTEWTDAVEDAPSGVPAMREDKKPTDAALDEARPPK